MSQGPEVCTCNGLTARSAGGRTVTAMTTIVDDAQPQPTLTELAVRIEAAAEPLSRLAEMRLLRDLLKQCEIDAVREARRGSASWAAIGSRLGVSRQAALKRFGETPGPAGVAAAQGSGRQTDQSSTEPGARQRQPGRLPRLRAA